MPLRLSALRAKFGKVRATPYPVPPPQGGEGAASPAAVQEERIPFRRGAGALSGPWTRHPTLK